MIPETEETYSVPIFGVDSKKHYKAWKTLTGEDKQFKALLGVVVNPLDRNRFEKDYDETMDGLFDEYYISKKQLVYKSSEIGSLLAPNVAKYMSFCLAFTRKILNLDYVKVTYCVTRINKKYLTNEKVTIGGYGTTTKQISIPEFIDMLECYYNVICAWKVSQMTGIKSALFLFDGEEDIPRCEAWNELSSTQNIEIVYSGDKIERVISSADIILKSLDFFLKQTKSILSEDKIREIVLYDGKIKPENKFFVYIGNPDLQKIKPLSPQRLNLSDLQKYIRHPIIFVSGGGLPGQKLAIEGLPLFNKLISKATELHASLRNYDPKKDRHIIGRTEIEDYFIPLNEIARNQFEMLKNGGANIGELKI
jgi:hypothetical protein